MRLQLPQSAIRAIVTAAAMLSALWLGQTLVEMPMRLITIAGGLLVMVACLTNRWLGLLLLLSIAPFYGFLRFVIELSPTQILFKEFMIVLITAGWLIEDIVIKREKMIANRISPLLGMFLAVIFVQYLRSPDPMQAMYGLRVYVTYVPVFFVLLTEQPSERWIKIAVTLIVAATTVTLIYGFWQSAVGLERLKELGLAKAGPNISAIGVIRVFSTYAGPEYFGLNLVLQMMVLSGVLPSLRRRWVKVACFALIIAMSALLLLTLYRSLWIMAIISFGALLFLTRRYAYVLLVAAALVGVMFFLPDYIKTRAEMSFGQEDESYQIRRALYLNLNVANVANNMIGYGVGSSLGLETFQSRTGRRSVYKLLGGGITESWLASVSIELGLLGLIVYVWMMIRIIAQSVAVYHSGLPPLWRGLGVGFASFAIGMLVLSAFFMAPTLLPAGDLYFWFMTGLMVVLGRRAEELSEPPA